MKTYTTAAALLSLFVASANAADPVRRRTMPQYKSLSKARGLADESYDPYLGMGNRQLAKSMSVSMSMDDVPPDTKEGKEDSGASYLGSTVSVLAAAGAVMLL